MSQRRLAELSGVAQNAISELERGRRRPRPGTVESLAAALGVPPAVLLGASDSYDAPQALVTRDVPMFGAVPAGHPSEAEPGEQLQLFPVPAHLWGESRYVLRVDGDSMWPKYQNGDLVLVEYVESAEPITVAGKTCICLHNRASTIKVVDVHKNADKRRIVLRGANVDSPVIVVEDGDELRIQGRVIGIVQRLD